MIPPRRTPTSPLRAAADKRNPQMKTDDIRDSSVLKSDDSSPESEIAELRQRWELASVLNFLRVFEPVIESDLKLTAEDIELGLIKPNKAFASLHVMLLQGIPPVNRKLFNSDAWITMLCKKLAEWWPSVAEGELPLTESKGEEISKYKELDPISRLVMLKALCEIRAVQYDAVSFINDGLKEGKDVSCFCKVEVGRTGNGTLYWYDGDDTLGHRLYKEVKRGSMKRAKGKARSVPTVCFEWETLATNLEEFRSVVDGLTSSKVAAEVSVGKNIEATIIPLVEKLQKRKEMALKRKQKDEMRLNVLRNFVKNRVTRERKPISYTFDEYDMAIDEALEIPTKRKKKSKSNETQTHSQEEQQERIVSNGGLDAADATKNEHPEIFNDEDREDNDYDGKNDSSDSGIEKNDRRALLHPQKPPRGPRWSKRLAGDNLSAAKNRSRQRPVLNSAVDLIIPDSDDEVVEYQSLETDSVEVNES